MDYTAICVAILLWLVRPQDWMTGLAGVGFTKYAMLAAIIGFFGKPTSQRSSFGLHSPADYIVLTYLGWIIYTTGNYFDTFKEVFPFAVFYLFTSLVLDTAEKLQVFLKCWCVGLFVVAFFALSTPFGFEIAEGSADLTSMFNDRLALNTWIFNNPNSLGHGVAALIPFSYALFWWRRSLLSRLVVVLMVSAAGYCVFLTQSKGAYLCGFASFCAVFLFRKRLLVQVIALVLALTSGVAAIKLLPRMDTMNAREDGIAGRLVIWQMAHAAMENTKIGEGWKKFEAWVRIPKLGMVRKATHGSYVNVGADLGYPGLFLFLAILYANGRTVLCSRPREDDVLSQQNQKALLSLLCSYVASAWMIDRAYHTDFFFIAGAIAAFHRQMTRPQEEGELDAQVRLGAAASGCSIPRLPQFGLRVAGEGAALSQLSPEVLHPLADTLPLAPRPGRERVDDKRLVEASAAVTCLKWTRLGLLDLALIYVLFEAVDYVWVEVMTNFISF